MPAQPRHEAIATTTTTPSESIPRRQNTGSTITDGRPEFEVLREEPTTASGINVEEEVRLYEELCREYDEEASQYDRRSMHLPRPAESIFSADIYLGDNRGGGSFATDVKISGWTTVAGDKVPSLEKGRGLTGLGSGAYVVYDCVVTTKENTTFHFLKRYTAFEDLEYALRKTLPPVLRPAIPKLPPKAPFARFRPAFLDKRRQHLQFWLARVLLHPEIGQSEAVKRWVMA
ncbi:hypothetical protein CC1G_10249 [Coprinopsis cinerea okayama7|uniref:Endosomal/vacuolar adapter protein YPT35 n=1 Tax=Coprinopsis cinerea (strain Okayama-7 / 130 / ATCC MYA-4618 / FGSC 9003) TaxID=240176 RepID=A8NPE8_COPC7|nr:hypothetical protein CC1G_10249 [Coprinopsis cinerea okayama7\|eukprot:XP_001835322.1 hypothetical protein CC1G_10249 [Coprinopsis cinerea okayama7\